MQAPPINEEQMQELIQWLDQIPFSRPKRNLSRDFSDGVLTAEIMKQYYPKIVQLHNFPSGNALNSKFANWKTLNDKIFKKLKIQINPNDIQNIITVTPGSVQKVLFHILTHLKKLGNHKSQTSSNAFESSSKIQDYSNTYVRQLAERQDTIGELRGTIQMLQVKMKKIQELNRLKDAKIESLIRKLEEGVN